MIIALLALAFAMILGGLLATFFGWDIIMVERGWTMVIAGSISAASGALLLGITAAVSKLARIQTELEHLHLGLDEESFADARASTGASMASPEGILGGPALGRSDAKEEDDAQETLPLFDDGDRRERDTAASVPDIDRPEAEETVLPFPPRTRPEPAALQDVEASDLRVPDFLLADRDRDERSSYAQDAVSETDASFYGAGRAAEEHGGRRDADADHDDLLEPAAEPAPEPAAAEQDMPARSTAPEETRQATVVGTYNSGDNKYVMFSDGSIEAQTPGGVFHFGSLDELKEFIASGGENRSSASP